MQVSRFEPKPLLGVTSQGDSDAKADKKGDREMQGRTRRNGDGSWRGGQRKEGNEQETMERKETWEEMSIRIRILPQSWMEPEHTSEAEKGSEARALRSGGYDGHTCNSITVP